MKPEKKKQPDKPVEKSERGHLKLVDLVDRMPPPGEAGSIEQQLDMLESGPLRGDEILHEHGDVRDRDRSEGHPEIPTEDEMQRNYHIDMAEPNREGDEMSGDEHSAGLQGGDSEYIGQDNVNTGLPGEEVANENRKLRKRQEEGT